MRLTKSKILVRNVWWAGLKRCRIRKSTQYAKAIANMKFNETFIFYFRRETVWETANRGNYKGLKRRHHTNSEGCSVWEEICCSSPIIKTREAIFAGDRFHPDSQADWVSTTMADAVLRVWVDPGQEWWSIYLSAKYWIFRIPMTFAFFQKRCSGEDWQRKRQGRTGTDLLSSRWDYEVLQPTGSFWTRSSRAKRMGSQNQDV